jgi:hypothetical protein
MLSLFTGKATEAKSIAQPKPVEDLEKISDIWTYTFDKSKQYYYASKPKPDEIAQPKPDEIAQPLIYSGESSVDLTVPFIDDDGVTKVEKQPFRILPFKPIFVESTVDNRQRLNTLDNAKHNLNLSKEELNKISAYPLMSGEYNFYTDKLTKENAPQDSPKIGGKRSKSRRQKRSAKKSRKTRKSSKK